MLEQETIASEPNWPVEAAIDSLIGRYSEAVDSQGWQQWLDAFTDDGSYAVYSRDNLERGLSLGYMIDDCRPRLEDRVKFITEVWVGTVEPYRTRHLVQRTGLERVDDGTYTVRSNVIVTYSEPDSPSEVLVSGVYEDRIRIDDDQARFASKVVYLDSTPARYLVYPL